ELRAKAYEYLEKAAEQSNLSGRYREALAFLDEAAELDRAADGARVSALQQARWQRMMGDAYFGLGQLDVAGEHCERALALLGQVAPRAPLRVAAGLAVGLGRQAVHLLVPRAVTARRTGRRESLAEAALAASRLAERYYFSFDAMRMVASSLMAVNLAERAGQEA